MYTEKSFRNLIDYWGERSPEREAIFDGQLRITYGELNKEVQQLSSALTLLDIQKNDKVLILLPNWYEFIALYMAIAKIGAIAVPCNCALKGKELEQRIHIIDPKAVFVSNSSQLSWLRENYEFPLIVTTRFKEDGYDSYIDLLHLGDLLKIGENSIFDQVEIDPKEDLYAILFTSGSTGHPKGVQVTPHNLFQSAKSIGFRINCSSQDTVLVPLPCGHTFGLLAGVLMPLFFGAKIVLMEKHRPIETLDLIGQEKVTVHLGVPTMFIRELEHFRNDKRNISSLRTGIVAGAPCPETIMRQIYSEFNVELMNLYGSSEAMGISMTGLYDSMDRRFQTSGRIFEGVELKVINEEGSSAGQGLVGELAVKGEGLMKGYYQMPRETAEVIDEDGWFHTGDLVTVDSLGYIKIVGRKKDLIIRGGNNIVPAEVECIYFSHPSVVEVYVFGIPDNILGERTYACITLKENCKETETTLKEYAIGKIAKYKIPDHIVLLQEMPRLANGKINKKSLVDYCIKGQGRGTQFRLA
ncbi:class I adenylate-forming enzyme family protein [Bacillus benzoevorans]|uniref:Fatty-acyl-CoA synthase/long-chain acyl-CoA synthetase n=1 Tax=Bacillus benzoevorans TaxID=1456 RepID=A0A7X0HU28_9BACI|nr:class I adenylate-forming enzyme family protein [Bacillus benzoevorans]MBB6446872.1 fatty-acyl-CoA synthase/long-chain acyl-CoA synthetase [Bacillus benzoevorans]